MKSISQFYYISLLIWSGKVPFSLVLADFIHSQELRRIRQQQLVDMISTIKLLNPTTLLFPLLNIMMKNICNKGLYKGANICLAFHQTMKEPSCLVLKVCHPWRLYRSALKFVYQSQLCSVGSWPKRVIDFCSTQFISCP